MTFAERLAAAEAALAAAEEVVRAAQASLARANVERDAAWKALTALRAQAVNGGPDVSEHNGDVDWAKVAAGRYEFAFVRVSDGDRQDKLFTPARVQAVRAAGLRLGVYHFARVANPGNGERDGRTEAGMALYFAKSRGALIRGDLPLVYDFEGESLMGQTPGKAAKHLMQFVRAYECLSGHPPIVYTTPSIMVTVRPGLSPEDLTVLSRCPLWIAHWDVAAPAVPAPWKAWAFWQYTDKASFPGITGPADGNRFYGSLDDLRALTAVV